MLIYYYKEINVDLCKASFVKWVITLTKKDKTDNWDGVKRKVVNNKFAWSIAFSLNHCYEIKETCVKYAHPRVCWNEWKHKMVPAML